MSRLLDAGFELTLRPMRYPKFYEMYRGAIKNTWSVEEILQGAPVDDPEDAQNVRSYVDLAEGVPRGRGAGPEPPAVVVARERSALSVP